MGSDREPLQQQRERLRLRSEKLRQSIALHAQALERPLALVDQMRVGVHWVRTHPEVPRGALLALLLLRPRRLLRWSAKLWWGWKLWRRGRRLLQGLTAWVA